MSTNQALINYSTEFSIPEEIKSDRRNSFRFILSHSLHYWQIIVIMIFGALCNAGLAAVVPVLTGRAFNTILGASPSLNILFQISVLIIVSQIVRGVTQFARNFGAELLGQRLERDIRHELYVSLLGKSMTFHNLQPVGDTMARATNDVREINLMFNPGINLVLGSAVFMLVPLFIAPRYHPSLIVPPLLFLICYYIAIWFYLRELHPIAQDIRKNFGRLNSRLAETIDGIETVKGTSQEKSELERFGNHAREFRDAFIRQGDAEARNLPLLLLGVAEAMALLQALYLFQVNQISIGDVVAYFGLIQLLGFPTFVSLFAYSQVALGIASADRILDIINRQNNLDQNLSGYSGPMIGDVEFHDVSFSFIEGETSLNNLSFKVSTGQTVAIVGQTGSGKTTLVKLINRIYDASSGQVLVDGIDVKDWNLEVLRRNISTIEQDIFLFSRKIIDNIKFGAPEADFKEITNAAKDAQVDEFIRSLPDEYETVIGERGVTLSGGQRQRIALARAFLSGPKILILDDSTSAIDSATEDEIQKAIYTASRGRTTFIITHRLSQIRWADLILVMRKGELTALGTHEELMKKSKSYREIFSD